MVVYTILTGMANCQDIGKLHTNKLWSNCIRLSQNQNQCWWVARASLIGFSYELLKWNGFFKHIPRLSTNHVTITLHFDNHVKMVAMTPWNAVVQGRRKLVSICGVNDLSRAAVFHLWTRPLRSWLKLHVHEVEQDINCTGQICTCQHMELCLYFLFYLQTCSSTRWKAGCVSGKNVPPGRWDEEGSSQKHFCRQNRPCERRNKIRKSAEACLPGRTSPVAIPGTSQAFFNHPLSAHNKCDGGLYSSICSLILIKSALTQCAGSLTCARRTSVQISVHSNDSGQEYELQWCHFMESENQRFFFYCFCRSLRMLGAKMGHMVENVSRTIPFSARRSLVRQLDPWLIFLYWVCRFHS